MNSLDSRRLTPGDCFAQRFPSPGQVRCLVSAASSGGAGNAGGDEDLIIEVTPRAVAESSPKQVNVLVKSDGKGGLDLDTKRLSIETGDGVLFYATYPPAIGFVIRGEGPNFTFDSARMRDGAIYTHAFGSPGRYEWIDPYRGGISGVVQVSDYTVKETNDRDRWFEILKKPAAFEIKGDYSSPKQVDIVVGQTVFWSVSDSRGVSITDARLGRVYR
jgi:hypothetical protein